MAGLTRVQRYGLIASQAGALVGLNREIVVNTTDWTISVHDGLTAGGHPVAKADASNIQQASGSQSGVIDSASFSAIASNTSRIATIESVIGSGGSNIPNLAIESGTVMVFFQSTAPTGFTLVNTQNDRVIRVESSGGGVVGGSWIIDDLTSPSHTHGMKNHTHAVVGNTGDESPDASLDGNNDDIRRTVTDHVHSINITSQPPNDNVTDGTAVFVNSAGTWRPAYIDCILCSKD